MILSKYNNFEHFQYFDLPAQIVVYKHWPYFSDTQYYSENGSRKAKL